TSLLQKLGDIELPELTDSSADEEINITLNRSTLEMLRNLSKEITESENKQLRRAENRQAKLNGEKPKYPRKKNAKKAGEETDQDTDPQP
ncbi:DNA-binding protein, partial [Escherichia coli]|nr:DNA-binding protein [Escherichia coli]